jgi:hypothetical protein
MKFWTSKNGEWFFWNVSADVGLNSRNDIEDVGLVQFAFKSALLLPDTGFSFGLQAQIRKLVVTQPCSGRMDDPLVAVIFAFQKEMKMPQVPDGKISTIKEGVYVDGSGQHTANLIMLGGFMESAYQEVFPRIDLIPGCPSLTARKSRYLFTGSAYAPLA